MEEGEVIEDHVVENYREPMDLTAQPESYYPPGQNIYYFT